LRARGVFGSAALSNLKEFVWKYVVWTYKYRVVFRVSVRLQIIFRFGITLEKIPHVAGSSEIVRPGGS
jgi:hypothetical protein